MVGIKYTEEICECGMKQGANINCSYCRSFAEAMTLGELTLRLRYDGID